MALAISWLVGYLIAWYFTRRIRRLESAAERLAEGDFETPIRDSGRDEVGQLADAFDSMRSRLAVLDRARGEFIANASHELRTPLFSLGGFVELLDDEGMDPAVRRDFLAEMRDQIDRLTRLATDLLDLSRLDAGQLEVETASFDLRAAARLVVDEFRAVAESSGRELMLDGDADLYALGDDVRVQQIARVFVENAIRHTPPGTPIAVSVRNGTVARCSRSWTAARGFPRRTRNISSSASTAPRGQGLRQRTRARHRVRARNPHGCHDRGQVGARADRFHVETAARSRATVLT